MQELNKLEVFKYRSLILRGFASLANSPQLLIYVNLFFRGIRQE
jgi:hypothetical protein